MGLMLEPRHKDIVSQVLSEHLSDNIKNLYAFGSRAKNTARPQSDLDLVYRGSLSKVTLSNLREAFEESNLPIKVDLLCWDELDENFKSNIQADLLPIAYW
jgi:predicted nucleotidyltransferase